MDINYRLMHRLIFVLLFFICFWNQSQAQSQKLIAAEYKRGDGGYTYLTSYNFESGKFISKDTILEGASDLLGDFVGNEGQVLKNQNILTSRGSLIDYKKKEIIWKVNNIQTKFIEDKGDSLIFEETIDGLKYYCLNLKNLSYKLLPEGTYNRTNKAKRTLRSRYFSPNGQKSIYTAYLKKIKIQDKYFNTLMAIENISGPIVVNLDLSRMVAIWLDDDNFLYDNYIHHKEKNQHTVEIRQYTLSSQTDVLIHQIESNASSQVPWGKFSKDYKNQIHYKANDGRRYLVDLHQKPITRNPLFYLNEDFSYKHSLSNNKIEGVELQFKEQDIGAQWAVLDPKVSKDAIALEYGDVGSNLGYPKGLRIWTKAENKWLTFDPPWIASILGWIQE